MSNAFDSANYPETEPATIIAGDRIAWKRTDLGGDYPPASYALSYKARLNGAGSTSISISASESGSEYIVEVGASTSASWTPGTYTWQAYITRSSDSERITVDSGTFQVLANRATATSDPRSHARIVLDAVEAVIEGRASKDQQSYSIGGRSLARMPITDLLLLRNQYKIEVNREKAAERIANGLDAGNTIRVRF
jgi:hypothetical protein